MKIKKKNLAGSILPCGPGLDPCTSCDVVLLANNIFGWLVKISLGVAILTLAVAGIFYITAGGSSQLLEKAKRALKYVLVGFALALLGWVSMNILAKGLGYTSPGGEWWQLGGFECSFKITRPAGIRGQNDLAGAYLYTDIASGVVALAGEMPTFSVFKGPDGQNVSHEIELLAPNYLELVPTEKNGQDAVTLRMAAASSGLNNPQDLLKMLVLGRAGQQSGGTNQVLTALVPGVDSAGLSAAGSREGRQGGSSGKMSMLEQFLLMWLAQNGALNFSVLNSGIQVASNNNTISDVNPGTGTGLKQQPGTGNGAGTAVTSNTQAASIGGNTDSAGSVGAGNAGVSAANCGAGDGMIWGNNGTVFGVPVDKSNWSYTGFFSDVDSSKCQGIFPAGIGLGSFGKGKIPIVFVPSRSYMGKLDKFKQDAERLKNLSIYPFTSQYFTVWRSDVLMENRASEACPADDKKIVITLQGTNNEASCVDPPGTDAHSSGTRGYASIGQPNGSLCVARLGNSQDAVKTFSHELGHMFGLYHNSKTCVMGNGWPNKFCDEAAQHALCQILKILGRA